MNLKALTFELSAILLSACETISPTTHTSTEIPEKKLAPENLCGRHIRFDYTKAMYREGHDTSPMSWDPWKMAKNDTEDSRTYGFNDVPKTPTFGLFNVAMGKTEGKYVIIENEWKYTVTGPNEAILEHSHYEGVATYKLTFKSEKFGYASLADSGEGAFFEMNSIMFYIPEEQSWLMDN